MHLFHYSTRQFDELLTPREQDARGIRTLTQKEIDFEEQRRTFHFDPYSRIDEIALMIDPLPIDIIRKAGFPDSHKAYGKGTQLIEYKIDINKLDLKHWELAETPLNSVLRHYLFFEPTLFKRTYFLGMKIARKIQRYEGNSLQRLIQVHKKFTGKTAGYFSKWINSSEFEETKSMYAAGVPHFLVYPRGGVVQFSSYQTLVL